MKSKFFIVLAIAMMAGIIAVTATSCVGLEADPNSDLPQNAPADWENTTFGVAI